MSLQLRQWFFLDPIDPYDPLYNDEDPDFLDNVVDDRVLLQRRNVLFARISPYIDLTPLQEVKTFWRRGYRKLSTIGHTILPFRVVDPAKRHSALLDLAELLIMLQHADMFFLLLARYVKNETELKTIRAQTFAHLLATNAPFSIRLFDELAMDVLKLQPCMHWSDQVRQWLPLLCTCRDTSYRGVLYVESHIYQLLHSNIPDLVLTFDHVDLYRDIFDVASVTLRFVMSHNFGRPATRPKVTTSSSSKNYTSMPTLTELAFNCAYRYYEYRNVLRSYLQLVSLHSPVNMQQMLSKILVFNATTDMIRCYLPVNRVDLSHMRKSIPPSNICFYSHNHEDDDFIVFSANSTSHLTEEQDTST